MMEQLNNITLHFGDCMDMLKNMPDKSFDLAIVDPPYFRTRTPSVLWL